MQMKFTLVVFELNSNELFSSICWAPLSTRQFPISYVHADIILQIGILIGYMNNMLRDHITSTIWPFLHQNFFALKFYLVQYHTRLPFIICSKARYLHKLSTQFVVYQLLRRTNLTIVVHCNPHVCSTNISSLSLQFVPIWKWSDITTNQYCNRMVINNSPKLEQMAATKNVTILSLKWDEFFYFHRLLCITSSRISYVVDKFPSKVGMTSQ